MNEKIIRIVEEERSHGITCTIAETMYEFGRHYVLFVNGEPGYHSIDYERVHDYMESWMRIIREK